MFKQFPEKYRRQLPGRETQSGDNLYGMFIIPHQKIVDYFYLVMVSGGMGWEHISVSLQNKKKHVERCPTWGEMCYIKEMFFTDDTPVVQYHPKKEDYVSMHEFCLHLWHPTDQVLPIPYPIMVGIKQLHNTKKL